MEAELNDEWTGSATSILHDVMKHVMLLASQNEGKEELWNQTQFSQSFA